MRTRQSGATLVELVLSIVIISVSVGGGLLAITTMIGSSADSNRVQQATNIAEAYLEEVRLQPMDDPDGVGGETRADYDNVLDYSGLDETPPRDQTGTALTALTGYRVRVTITASAAFGPSGTQVAAADAYRVDVRVTYGSNVDLVLSTHRVRL